MSAGSVRSGQSPEICWSIFDAIGPQPFSIRLISSKTSVIIPSCLPNMTNEGEQPSTPAAATPKKRFIGKARAEALRKKAAEHSGSNIEDGVIATRGMFSQLKLF